MIELKVKAENKGKYMGVECRGQIDGHNEELLYEMLGIIKELDEVGHGLLFTRALKIWLNEKEGK